MTETNQARNQIYQSFLHVAHRDYAQIVPGLRTAFEHDPDFIARACVDFTTGGTDIRDLADCAAIVLLTAPAEYTHYREAGRCVLLGRGIYPTIQPADMKVPGIPPFSKRIFRISDYISRDRGHKAPRFMRSVIVDFLSWLESDVTRFDAISLWNYADLKNLYIHYHVSMGDYAKAILYDDNPPEHSKRGIIKAIAATDDPTEKARLVIEGQIPYVIATSLLTKITPATGVALIAAMSPQEALNSRNWVEQSGLLNIPEVKQVYLDKVSRASASVASAEHRRSAQGSDADVQKAADAAKELAVARQQHYDDNIALLMDKSGSMENSIQIATELATRIAPLCTGDFWWIAFDSDARQLNMRERSLAGAKQAVMGVRAGGGTNVQAAFDMAVSFPTKPQKVVVVSDGDPMQGSFSGSVVRYMQNSGNPVKIIFVRVPGGHDSLTGEMQRAGLDFDRFETDGRDYNVFDAIAKALGAKAGKSLVERILEIQLPYRA